MRAMKTGLLRKLVKWLNLSKTRDLKIR